MGKGKIVAVYLRVATKEQLDTHDGAQSDRKKPKNELKKSKVPLNDTKKP